MICSLRSIFCVLLLLSVALPSYAQRLDGKWTVMFAPFFSGRNEKIVFDIAGTDAKVLTYQLKKMKGDSAKRDWVLRTTDKGELIILPHEKDSSMGKVIAKPQQKKPEFVVFSYGPGRHGYLSLGISMTEGKFSFKTEKAAREFAAQNAHFEPVVLLASEEKMRELESMKDPMLMSKEDLISVLRNFRTHILNNTKSEHMMIGFFIFIIDEMEALGYNQGLGHTTFYGENSIFTKYKDDPEVKKISDELQQHFRY